MNILVTGGHGFVGSHIAYRLVAEGHDVTILDDLSAGVQLGPASCLHVKRSLGDWQGGDLGVFDAIVHCAAKADIRHNWRGVHERRRLIRDNIDGTVEALEFAYPGRPFVFVSTGALYDETAHSPYAATKLAGEAFVRAYLHNRSPWYIVRPAAVVGAGYHHGHTADFVRMAKGDGHIRAVTDGFSVRSYVHATDVAAFVSYVLSGSMESGTYGVAGGRWSARETVELMQKTSKVPFSVTWTDRDRGWRGDAAAKVPSGPCTGWYPRFTVVEGVHDALRGLEW